MSDPYIVPPDDACGCGRLASRVHCPNCGVYGVYARSHKKNNIKVRGDGSRVELQTYQCRRCGRVFDDDDWQTNCRAPRPMRAGQDVGRAIRRHETPVAAGKATSVAQLDLANDPEAPEMLREALKKLQKKYQ